MLKQARNMLKPDVFKAHVRAWSSWLNWKYGSWITIPVLEFVSEQDVPEWLARFMVGTADFFEKPIWWFWLAMHQDGCYDDA